MFKPITVERDAPKVEYKKLTEIVEVEKKILIENYQSPGDILMLTSAVRDLAKVVGKRWQIGVKTSCGELWENNPYITKFNFKEPNVQVIRADYPLIHKSNALPYHFIHGFRKDLEMKLNINIPQGPFEGDIHLSDAEKSWISQYKEITGKDDPFWIIVSGGKLDYTNKWWDPARSQEVVDHFKNKIQFVQCGSRDHHHPPLKGVIDLRGKTDLRQMVRLMYWSHGVVCPVTMFMHLSAAVPAGPGQRPKRPCVVTAGGREGTQWEMYPWHQYLHTVGQLKCCETGGCWKSRVVPIGDGDQKDKDLCHNPVETKSGAIIPKCQDMITSKKVIEAIEGYLEYEK
jgi:ADP-heptose:LPS heptosyltransferase